MNDRKESVTIILFQYIYPTRCKIIQFIIPGNCSICFGWYPHPSSGAHTIVFTASGNSSTIAAGSSNGVTNTRCSRYSRMRSWWWVEVPPETCRAVGRKSQLSFENKLLVYKVILKPVWAYGIQLWVTASNSNLETLDRFQSKVLCIITDAPRYVPNAIIKRDLQISTVKQEARKYSANYRKRLDTHPNNLANALFQEQLGTRGLKRLYPADLVTNGQLSTQQHSPVTTSILAIDNRRENFTGRVSYMSLTLSTQRLLNVSGQIVTTRGLTL